MGFSAGTRLGPYEIVSELGAGGMGEVYRARDTRLERTVAIKVLNSALVASPDLKARFEREAKAISQLNHPNICVLHDVGSEVPQAQPGAAVPCESSSGEKIDFLVMEFLDGESLADRIKNKGALPLNEVVKIGSEIADALDRAHRAGIVHRDLKPGNVMLTKTAAKLLDFGLAKPAAMGAVAAASGSAPLLSAAMTMTSPSPQQSPLTQQGALVGTVQYMSPEQIKGMEADARSDIFAFGSVLYEMATGKRAFEGKSQIKVASAILEDEPQPVSATTQAAPAALDRLIRTCLAKDPDERFQSALDVKLQLKWIGETPLPSQRPASERGWKQRLLWAGIVATLGCAMAAALWIALRPRAVVREVTRFHVDLGKLEFAGRSGARVAISPDGRTIAAVVVDEAGKQALYLRRMDDVTLTRLANTDSAEQPFFSPDSQWVGFSANSKLMKVPISGGVPVTICDLQDNEASATWGDDGTIVFATQHVLAQVSADGGTPAPMDWAANRHYSWVHSLPGGRALLAAGGRSGTFAIDVLRMDTHSVETIIEHGSWPRYLSSGYIVYAQFSATAGASGFTGGVLAVPFDLARLKRTGAPVPVLQNVTVGYGGAGYLDVARNGTAVYGPATERADFPASELVWTDRLGKTTLAGAPPHSLGFVRLSPDGSRAVFELIEGNPEIYTFDFARKTLQRVTFGFAVGPVFAPDGKRIAYTTSSGGPASKIMLAAADGSGNPTELLQSESPLLPTSFSPDGSVLAYDETRPTTHRDVYLASVRGDPSPRPLVNSGYQEGGAEISPDGKFFAYVSDESGANEVFVQGLSPKGGKWQISSGRGTNPRWSRDGKQLFYAAPGGKLMFVNVKSQNGFSADTPKLLFEIRGFNRAGYDVAPDGRILWARPLDGERLRNTIGVIENFDMFVQRRVAAPVEK